MSTIAGKLAGHRKKCVEKGTYLTEFPTEELAWFTVPATKASYLIWASDAPSDDTVPGSDNRPDPVEVSMVIKVFPLMRAII